MKTLQEHLKEAREKRWSATSKEKRTAIALAMNSKRWAGHVKKALRKLQKSELE